MFAAIFFVTGFILRAIGDVQVSNPQEVEYASRSLFPELMQPAGEEPVLNLFLGDQTNKDLSLMPVIHQMFDQLPDAYHTVVGNHDRDLNGTTAIDSTYRANFGAPYYSFDQENVHFIVLNNVYSSGVKSYVGRIPTEQLEWLREDVKKVSRKKQLVVAMHIPAAMTKNADSLYQIFEEKGCRNLLILSGHLHQVARRVVCRPSGLQVNELSAGAACGFWWTGEREADGVPAAMMPCGTPRGYFVFHFDNEGYDFHFKGINQDEAHQMTIYVAGVDSLDQHVEALAARPLGSVYATIYGACDSTEVLFQLDNGPWMKARHAPVMDSNVARIRQFNLDKIFPTHYNRINPYRQQISSQVWCIDYAPEQLQGVHTLRIQASDRWGFHAQGTKVVYLKTP